jgi:hypothetical protein
VHNGESCHHRPHLLGSKLLVVGLILFQLISFAHCKDPSYAPYPNRIDILYGSPYQGKPLPDGPIETLLKANDLKEAGIRLWAMSGALNNLCKAEDRSFTGEAFKNFIYASGGSEALCREIERSISGWINVVDRLAQESREVERQVQQYTGVDPHGEAECKAIRWSSAILALRLMDFNNRLFTHDHDSCAEHVRTVKEIQSRLREAVPEIKRKCTKAFLPKNALIPPEVENALTMKIVECQGCENILKKQTGINPNPRIIKEYEDCLKKQGKLN